MGEFRLTRWPPTGTIANTDDFAKLLGESHNDEGGNWIGAGRSGARLDMRRFGRVRSGYPAAKQFYHLFGRNGRAAARQFGHLSGGASELYAVRGRHPRRLRRLGVFRRAGRQYVYD